MLKYMVRKRGYSMNDRYPMLEVKYDHLVSNVRAVISKCNALGINVTGVYKGTSGNIKVAEAFCDGGLKSIASSRINELKAVRNKGLNVELMLIRIPMLSEVEDVVKYSDVSLESEIEVIKAINKEASKQNKVHDIILMADIGDLREGYWDKDEMADIAFFIDNNLKNIHLRGIGTNVGCYGSVAATPEKLSELVSVAELVESRIGRKLEIISGGATSSYMRVLDKDMPKGINHLRIGEEILLARDLDMVYNHKDPDIYQDCFSIKAEVIEVKRKPTHPVGELAVDAFCRTPEYEDRGIRNRALLGIGRADFAYLEELVPVEEGIEVIGASSDHTIIDIEDAKREIKVGDIIEFKMNYALLLFLTHSENVNIKYI